MVCGLLLQTQEVLGTGCLPAMRAESEDRDTLVWLLEKHSWSFLSAVGRGCPSRSHSPGGCSTAHSAATGRYREPALLRADGSFWRHMAGSTALHVTGQPLEKAVRENSRQVYSWHP